MTLFPTCTESDALEILQ